MDFFKNLCGSLFTAFTLIIVILMFLRLLSSTLKFKTSTILHKHNRASRSVSIFVFEQGKELDNYADSFFLKS